MKKRYVFAVISALTLGLSGAIYAQKGGSSEDWLKAEQAFLGANTAMHQAMSVDYSGNPDVTFVRGMIPHHQGAVDMAKIVLVYGQDPEVQAFAQKIIDTQEAEIAWMKEWLAKNNSKRGHLAPFTVELIGLSAVKVYLFD